MTTAAVAMSKQQQRWQPAEVEPEHVMNYRGESVLGKKTILKSDYFPGCQNKRLLPQIDGAPNYRQALLFPDNVQVLPSLHFSK